MTRKMKDSGIEWIGEIPVEWRICRHKNIMRKEKVICEHYNNEDIISLTMSGVIVRNLNNGGKMPTTFDGYQYVEPLDLLLCLFDIDVTPRCVGLVKNYGITSPAYSKFKLKDGLCSSYYDYLLRTIDDKKVFVHLAKNLRSSLTENDFGVLPTIVPPLSEQRRISRFLDSECAKIDRLIEQTRASIEEYKKLKQAMITEAVTKGVRGKRKMKDSGIPWIGEIPEEWKLIKGKYLFRQRNEKGNRIEIQLLSPTQRYGVIPQSLYEKLTGMTAVKLDSSIDYSIMKSIYKGDYCISLRSFQGGFEYSEYNGVVSPAYQVFYSIVELNTMYYRYLFKEQSFISRMASFTNSFRDGKNISFSDFADSLIPVPPMEEQRRIVSYLDKICAEIDELNQKKELVFQELKYYKKSLIYEYVTGKKEVPA